MGLIFNKSLIDGNLEATHRPKRPLPATGSLRPRSAGQAHVPPRLRSRNHRRIHHITQLGVEVAKNLILAGPKQVTIYDTHTVAVEDVGRNFYCRTEHVGKTSRA